MKILYSKGKVNECGILCKCHSLHASSRSSTDSSSADAVADAVAVAVAVAVAADLL